MREKCPCGSNKHYLQCCGRFHSGEQRPGTAEQLMRSRYSAYCLEKADYLFETLHPAQRTGLSVASLSRELTGDQWLSLRVLDTVAGEAGDETGTVEFIAYFQQAGQVAQHQELSRFVREAGRWYYVDGDYKAGALETGRNDPCWCGSGKKFKKCHAS